MSRRGVALVVVTLAGLGVALVAGGPANGAGGGDIVVWVGTPAE